MKRFSSGVGRSLERFFSGVRTLECFFSWLEGGVVEKEEPRFLLPYELKNLVEDGDGRVFGGEGF